MERIELPGVPADMIANNLTPSYLIHPGEMIKDELEARGISQKELAAEIGISTSVINAVLNGKRNINTEIAMLLEASLGIDADIWLKLQSDYNKQKAKSDRSFMAKLAKVRRIASCL